MARSDLGPPVGVSSGTAAPQRRDYSITFRSKARRATHESVVRILVVDDEHAVRDVLARALERDGHVVVTAGSIAESRPLIQEGVELLVLDLGLPDGSGLELCRELRRDELSVPILILTAHTQVEL